jgi:ribosomal protein S18 acetylase RimI-like enzyme
MAGLRVTELTLERAGPDDLEAIAALMNAAYRAEQPGWNTESGYITGQRTDPRLLAEELAANPQAELLVARADGAIIATVQIAPEGEGAWSLGGLAVHPALQGEGLGAALLAAGEARVTARGGTRVRLTVVHVRDALIAWYGRRGYEPTGERRPFPYGDERFGRPLRDDLAFVVLEKRL